MQLRLVLAFALCVLSYVAAQAPENNEAPQLTDLVGADPAAVVDPALQSPPAITDAVVPTVPTDAVVQAPPQSINPEAPLPEDPVVNVPSDNGNLIVGGETSSSPVDAPSDSPTASPTESPVDSPPPEAPLPEDNGAPAPVIEPSPAADLPVEPPRATPEPSLSDAENFDLECEDVLDDFEAFECEDVESLNESEFDCVDFLEEPNFICEDVDGNEIECDESSSGYNGGSGTEQNVEAPSTDDAIIVGGDPNSSLLGQNGETQNLVGAGAAKLLGSFMFWKESAVVGLAMAAGALFVL